MSSQTNDLLRAKPLRCDDAAQANCDITDDCDLLCRGDSRTDGCGMSCPHHIGESEKRRQEFVIIAAWQDDKSPICQRNAHRFSLSASNAIGAYTKEPPMNAGGVDSIVAEEAGTIGKCERRDDKVTWLDRADVGTKGLNDANELGSSLATDLAAFHRSV
jgi:hypothetical protein